MIRIDDIKYRRLLHKFLDKYPRPSTGEGNGLKSTRFGWEQIDSLICLRTEYYHTDFDNPHLIYDGGGKVILYYNNDFAQIGDISNEESIERDIVDLLMKSQVVFVKSYREEAFIESFYLPVKIVGKISISP